jgi:hypothetical protein
MEAEVISIESIRRRRDDARRAEVAAFGKLPCPCCDMSTSAMDVVGGTARYVCDGAGSHDAVQWSYNGEETVYDHLGRRRMYFAY